MQSEKVTLDPKLRRIALAKKSSICRSLSMRSAMRQQAGQAECFGESN
jgi:hypothetical protein